MRYYTIADPHANFHATEQALRESGFFTDGGDKRLVVLGDVLDRGDETDEMVAFLLREQEKGELIFIRGNHEDLFLQALHLLSVDRADDVCYSTHYTNGTWHTLCALAKMREDNVFRYPLMAADCILRAPFVTDLLPNTVDYLETANHIFVHGWVPVRVYGDAPKQVYERHKNWREASTDDWKKARWLNGIDMACRHHLTEEKTVVCGHISASYGHEKYAKPKRKNDFSPFTAPGIVALDATSCASDTVNCMVLEE